MYSQEDHIELKKGSYYITIHVYKPKMVQVQVVCYYITIHVYKPKMVQGQVVFQWDPEPRGARYPSAWTVDAEAVLCTGIAVESHQIGRARRTRHTKQTDAYDLKYLSEREFERVNSNFIGVLSEL